MIRHLSSISSCIQLTFTVMGVVKSSSTCQIREMLRKLPVQPLHYVQYISFISQNLINIPFVSISIISLQYLMFYLVLFHCVHL